MIDPAVQEYMRQKRQLELQENMRKHLELQQSNVSHQGSIN